MYSTQYLIVNVLLLEQLSLFHSVVAEQRPGLAARWPWLTRCLNTLFGALTIAGTTAHGPVARNPGILFNAAAVPFIISPQISLPFIYGLNTFRVPEWVRE